jgi:transposase
MNRLKVENENAIKALARKGWSKRRVARELGLDRATVGRHWPEAPPNAAIPTLGSQSNPASSNAAISTLGPETVVEVNTAISTAGSRVAASAGRQSHCGPFRELIEGWCAKRLSAQRIYQDLVCEHQFSGSYQSVKRFVRKLEAANPLPFRRMECEPGDEAQVDFGQGAWIIDADGKRRRPNLFRLVLSHSRKGYTEAVWRQTTESFLRSLENSFRALGGVPRTLVIDNLRAAVSRSDWFDPEINPKLASFCEHYGTVILPTRPAMPRHKGKIEAGVKYAQNNALKGRQFQSLSEQNSYLSQWERTVADTRIHGTIRQQVGQFFESAERKSLLPLPADIFPVFSEAPRKVHRDGYVELEKAYYSVPPEYVGRQVWARWEARLVRIYNLRMEQIALHSRSEPGKFQTDPNHVDDRKRCVIERGVEWLLDRARCLGKYSGTWAEQMIRQRGPQGLRVLQGLLSLAEAHPASELEKACHKAIEHGSWRLREIKELLASFPRPTQSTFLEEHPLIRQLDAYENLIPVCFEPKTKNETETNP